MVDDISAAARIGLRDIVDVAAIGTVLEEEVAREVGRAGGAAKDAGLGQGLQTRRDTIDPGLDAVEEFAVELALQIGGNRAATDDRSEEHTSELQSIMRNQYAVFCMKHNMTT